MRIRKFRLGACSSLVLLSAAFISLIGCDAVTTSSRGKIAQITSSDDNLDYELLSSTRELLSRTDSIFGFRPIAQSILFESSRLEAAIGFLFSSTETLAGFEPVGSELPSFWMRQRRFSTKGFENGLYDFLGIEGLPNTVQNSLLSWTQPSVLRMQLRDLSDGCLTSRVEESSCQQFRERRSEIYARVVLHEAFHVYQFRSGFVTIPRFSEVSELSVHRESLMAEANFWLNNLDVLYTDLSTENANSLAKEVIRIRGEMLAYGGLYSYEEWAEGGAEYLELSFAQRSGLLKTPLLQSDLRSRLSEFLSLDDIEDTSLHYVTGGLILWLATKVASSELVESAYLRGMTPIEILVDSMESVEP